MQVGCHRQWSLPARACKALTVREHEAGIPRNMMPDHTSSDIPLPRCNTGIVLAATAYNRSKPIRSEHCWSSANVTRFKFSIWAAKLRLPVLYNRFRLGQNCVAVRLPQTDGMITIRSTDVRIMIGTKLRLRKTYTIQRRNSGRWIRRSGWKTCEVQMEKGLNLWFFLGAWLVHKKDMCMSC